MSKIRGRTKGGQWIKTDSPDKLRGLELTHLVIDEAVVPLHSMHAIIRLYKEKLLSNRKLGKILYDKTSVE